MCHLTESSPVTWEEGSAGWMDNTLIVQTLCTNSLEHFRVSKCKTSVNTKIKTMHYFVTFQMTERRGRKYSRNGIKMEFVVWLYDKLVMLSVPRWFMKIIKDDCLKSNSDILIKCNSIINSITLSLLINEQWNLAQTNFSSITTVQLGGRRHYGDGFKWSARKDSL